jgi:hypothetical protein
MTFFDKDKIQIKHILEIHKDMEGWPTADDLIYFICKRADDKNKTGTITFSDLLLKKKLPTALDDIIQSSLIELINNGLIEITRTSESKTSYKVLVNPYLNTKTNDNE